MSDAAVSLPEEASRVMARRVLWKGSAALAVIWIGALGLIAATRAAAPTPRSVLAYLAAHRIDGKSELERARIIDRLVDRIALLDYWNQRKVLGSPPLQQAYFACPVAEKERFLERLMFSSMKNLLRVAGALPPAEREAFLNKALDEAQENFLRDESQPINQHHLQEWIEESLREAFFDTPIALRMELKPVLDRVMPVSVPR